MREEKERWKTINGFKNVVDDKYCISDHGNVKCKYSDELPNTKVANKKHHPYRAVYLLKTTGKSEWVLVHQLVATFFVEMPKELIGHPDLVPDHLDNNGLNNHYTNLEWKTRGQNVSDAFKMGYIKRSGEDNHGSLITNDTAHDICRCLSYGMNYDEIIKFLEFPDTKQYRQLLVRIKNRLAWKDISSQYDFNSSQCQYTAAQRDTIKRIPLIRQLAAEGKTTVQIFNIVYSDCPLSQRPTKLSIIRNVRDNKIFQDI